MKKKIEVETVVVTEDGYEGGGENIALVVLPDQKIVFKSGKNIHLTSKTLSLTVGRGALIQTAPGSDLYAVHIDGKVGGALEQLTIQKGGTIGTQVTTVALKTALDLGQVEKTTISGALESVMVTGTRSSPKVKASDATWSIRFGRQEEPSIQLGYSNADVNGQPGSASVRFQGGAVVSDSYANYQRPFGTLTLAPGTENYPSSYQEENFDEESIFISDVRNIAGTYDEGGDEDDRDAGTWVSFADKLELRLKDKLELSERGVASFENYFGDVQFSNGAKFNNIKAGKLANSVITGRSFTVNGETYYNSSADVRTGEMISERSRFTFGFEAGAERSKQTIAFTATDSGSNTTTTPYYGDWDTHLTATAELSWAASPAFDLSLAFTTGYTAETKNNAGASFDIDNGLKTTLGVSYAARPNLTLGAHFATADLDAFDMEGSTNELGLSADFEIASWTISPKLAFIEQNLDDYKATGLGYGLAAERDLVLGGDTEVKLSAGYWSHGLSDSHDSVTMYSEQDSTYLSLSVSYKF